MNIINFSGGRTSAYMTKRLIDEGLTDYLVCFQNTGKEMPKTLDFINQCDKKWNLNIVWLEYRQPANFEIVNYETASRDSRPFDELLKQRPSGIPNQYFRFCTSELKINTLKRYLKSIGITEYTSFNGIRYDEPSRWGKAQAETELPLVKWKITKKDILDFWSKQDFDLEVLEPYGNCDCCFLKGKGKIMKIAKENPDLLKWWIDVEKKSGNTFKKEITYSQMLDLSTKQIDLFLDDPGFNCFCNID
jgi:3'-phosphoadenosine 5'-phosphosulfate sulfotransferase (PAPS reductase)/FAD synthetase